MCRRLIYFFSIIIITNLQAQERPQPDGITTKSTVKFDLSKYDSLIVNSNEKITSDKARLIDDVYDKSYRIILYKNDSVFVKSFYPDYYVCSVKYGDIEGFISYSSFSLAVVDSFLDRREIAKYEEKKLYEEERRLAVEKLKEEKLKERKGIYVKKYGKKWGTTVAEKMIQIGMTKEMVIDSWGQPDDINRTVGSWGTHEQWVYGVGQYLYFENGKLTSWQD